MRLKDNYFEIKNKYKNYILIMKSGTFYNVLGNDCYIFKNIFGYKVNNFSDTVKTLDDFTKVHNYIVYEGEIKLKGKFHRNKYEVFLKERLSISERIERITLMLNEIKNEDRIIQVLDTIEDLI